MARLLTDKPETIRWIAEQLRAGEIGGLPTETVYGLAADATNASAVEKVFSAKGRPSYDPLIIHVAFPSNETEAKAYPTGYDFETKPDFARKFIHEMGERGWVDLESITDAAMRTYEALIASFWPGPLTIIFPKGPAIAENVTAGLSTVGVRSPEHLSFQRVLRDFGNAIAAPSANRFGKLSPTSASHVEGEIGNLIPWILDGGRTNIGIESTVAKVLKDGRMIILRPGKIGAEELAKAADSEVLTSGQTFVGPGQFESPGNLDSHYSPSCPLYLFNRSSWLSDSRTENDKERSRVVRAVVSLWKYSSKETITAIEMFGENLLFYVLTDSLAYFIPTSAQALQKDLGSAAKNLYERLRSIDHLSHSKSDHIEILVDITELENLGRPNSGLTFSPSPESIGLASALLDRLNRASKK